MQNFAVVAWLRHSSRPRSSELVNPAQRIRNSRSASSAIRAQRTRSARRIGARPYPEAPPPAKSLAPRAVPPDNNANHSEAWEIRGRRAFRSRTVSARLARRTRTVPIRVMPASSWRVRRCADKIAHTRPPRARRGTPAPMRRPSPRKCRLGNAFLAAAHAPAQPRHKETPSPAKSPTALEPARASRLATRTRDGRIAARGPRLNRCATAWTTTAAV
jgi:hypothetical protein